MYCRHCGKEIDDDNSFCPFCGKKLTADQSPDSKSDSSKSNTLLIAVVALVVVAVVVVAAVLITKNAGNKQTAESNNVENQTTDNDQDAADDDAEQVVVEDEDSSYIVGETYIVKTNLRVREGPGKNYRILDRDELSAEDYAISVDSDITSDALLEKGKVVTCQEMSGDWMRISSGWICVYDEGERLVE